VRITVRVFGDLIPVLGREITFNMEEGASLKDLSNLLSHREGGSRTGYLGDHKIGEGELVILVDGRNIDTLDGIDTRLRDGDVVTLLPPFAGG
jgi:molybdopterin synthase sulfur carrier subunit